MFEADAEIRRSEYDKHVEQRELSKKPVIRRPLLDEKWKAGENSESSEDAEGAQQGTAMLVPPRFAKGELEASACNSEVYKDFLDGDNLPGKWQRTERTTGDQGKLDQFHLRLQQRKKGKVEPDPAIDGAPGDSESEAGNTSMATAGSAMSQQPPQAKWQARPKMQAATVAPSDFAEKGANESEEHYRTSVALDPPLELAFKPAWRSLNAGERESDPFYKSVVSETCDVTGNKLTGLVDQVGDSDSFDRPQRIYHVLWDNGEVTVHSMQKIVVMVTKTPLQRAEYASPRSCVFSHENGAETATGKNRRVASRKRFADNQKPRTAGQVPQESESSSTPLRPCAVLLSIRCGPSQSLARTRTGSDLDPSNTPRRVRRRSNGSSDRSSR
jgi:hypothetical protein